MTLTDFLLARIAGDEAAIGDGTFSLALALAMGMAFLLGLWIGRRGR